MDYFGEPLDAPIYAHADRCPVPVEEECWWCRVAFTDHDQGFRVRDHTPAANILTGEAALAYTYIHRECLLRAVFGQAVDELEEREQIEWWDEPEQNARFYRHRGCDEGDTPWVVPLDDCPPPARPEDECARCCHILPLAARA